MKVFSELADDQLATMYAEGNNAAFDELLARNQTGIFSYIIFIVQNEEVANDIFQDTFLKAITCLKEKRYTPSGQFSAWMIRIAHNVIMDWYRKQKTKAVVDTAVEDVSIAQMSDVELMETSKEDLLAHSEVIKDLRNLMEFLPQTQREVVQMRFYQNMSFKDIAARTHVSINTSLGRMRYALINLRRMAKENHIQLQLA